MTQNQLNLRTADRGPIPVHRVQWKCMLEQDLFNHQCNKERLSAIQSNNNGDQTMTHVDV